MRASFLYRSSIIYEIVTMLFYGKGYFSRDREISDLIPSNVTVVDFCCGPATIFKRFLRKKTFTTLDMTLTTISFPR